MKKVNARRVTRAEPAEERAGALEAAAGRLWAWLGETALPLWWRRGADWALGGFHEAIGQDGVPIRAPRRCIVQARQIHAYALASLAGWGGPGREAAEHGLGYFLQHYRRSDGLFRASIAADGAALDERGTLYDQAFALLGLRAGHALTGRDDYRTIAETLLTAIQGRFGLPGSGYREAGESPFQSNCQMHLFEATIAWSPAGAGFRQAADQIAHLALDRLIDTERGAVDEYYDADWRPAGRGSRPGMRRIEPGHQFEWAWLLLDWRASGGERPVEDAVRRLVEVGEKGVTNGLASGAVDAEGRMSDPLCRLWPQTERLRIAARLARRTSGARARRHEAAALEAARGLEQYLKTTIPGLWRDKWTGEGFVEEPAPASSLYHLANAIVAVRQAMGAGEPR